MQKLLFLPLILLLLAYNTQAQALRVKQLTGNCFVYTTWHTLDNGPFPANGLFVVTGKGVVMIDSPWDTTQTVNLLQFIERKYNQKVVLCIATHSHDDRTGSLDILKRYGVRTFTSSQTRDLCLQKGNPLPQYTFSHDTVFIVGGKPFHTYYPGAGHTRDNIVVWYPDDQLVYGGCLVKSMEANDLGYTGEADLKSWPVSIRNVMERYPDARFIIPGHQDWHSRYALKHTLELLQHPAEK